MPAEKAVGTSCMRPQGTCSCQAHPQEMPVSAVQPMSYCCSCAAQIGACKQNHGSQENKWLTPGWAACGGPARAVGSSGPCSTAVLGSCVGAAALKSAMGLAASVLGAPAELTGGAGISAVMPAGTGGLPARSESTTQNESVLFLLPKVCNTFG